MKKIILNATTALVCIISFNGLFGAANGEPESMEELNRRYIAAQSLQSLWGGPESSVSRPSHEASVFAQASSDEMAGRQSSTTLFDDAGTRKRTVRKENEDENREAKHQRIIEHPGEFATESDQINKARHREQFFQALAQSNLESALNELVQFAHYVSNPDALINIPAFDTFLHSNELLEYIKQIVSNLASNPYDLYKLQALYRFSAQNPELQDRLKYVLQHLLLFVGRNGRATPIDSNLAKKAFTFIQGLYNLGLLHSPQEQDPLNEPQRVNLPELSSNSIRLLMQFIERSQYLYDASKLLSRRDTAEQRARKIAHGKKLNENVVILFSDLTIQDLQELIHAATYLGLSKPLYHDLLRRILTHIRRENNGNFHMLDSLPLYMKKALATASIHFHPNPPKPPVIAPGRLDDPGHIPWQRQVQLFYKENNWRDEYLKVSILDLIEQHKIPAITVMENGQKILNLASLHINSLEGLAEIPGIEAVEGLNLAGNYLEKLPADAFKALPNLKKLNLSGRTRYFHLKELDLNAFRGLKNLEALFLANNGLQTTQVKLNIFDHLPALNYLDVRGNRIIPSWLNMIEKKIKKVTGHEPFIVQR